MDEIVDNFERAYARRFGEGVGYPEGGVDLMALRLDVRPADPLRAEVAVEVAGDATPEPSGARDVYWPEQRDVVATPVYTGGDIPAGTRLTGPALVDYADTTVVLRPGVDLVVEAGGNLTIELED